MSPAYFGLKPPFYNSRKRDFEQLSEACGYGVFPAEATRFNAPRVFSSGGIAITPRNVIPYLFRLLNLASSLLVAKLTKVPKAAVRAVCNTSPSEILAQMEQMVPPMAETRISFTFIHRAPFYGIFGSIFNGPILPCPHRRIVIRRQCR